VGGRGCALPRPGHRDPRPADEAGVCHRREARGASRDNSAGLGQCPRHVEWLAGMLSEVKPPPVPEARQPVLSKEPPNALTKTLIADFANPAYSRN
jgi:hypothetical protein